MISRHRASGKIIKPDPGTRCSACSKRVDVEELTLIDQQFHVPPSGCTDGDYWTHAEYAFQCLRCKSINRLLGISHERDRWAPHEWAPETDGRSRYARGERCRRTNCRSVFTPLLQKFARVVQLYEDYSGDTVNNYD